MADFHIEDREVKELEHDLAGAPLRIQVRASRVVKRTAEVIDEQMTEDAAGHMGNWFGLPGTEFATPLEQHVSHEMLDPLAAEIGIEAKGAGLLGSIIVHGSVNNPPTYDHTGPLRRTAPQYERWMGEAAEESVLGGDGAE